MSRIAAAFDLHPPIYLIKEFDNSVTFPSEGSGKFNPATLVPGSTYEVQGSGQDSTISPVPPQVTTYPPHSPFGSYPMMNKCSQVIPPSKHVPHPPMASYKCLKKIKKTILLVNLSARDGTRASSSKTNGLTYNVVTQVIVSISASLGECTVSAVADMVKAQVGFEVILLDSKLYPLMDNDSTTGTDFWKSTRKIIAASRSLYEKLGGVPANAELAQAEDDVVIVETSSKRKRIDTEAKLEEIDKKLEEINTRVKFVDEIRKVFECNICRSPVKQPVVALCCQRIIGCGECVQRWLLTNQRCPFCSITGRMDEIFNLKGMDDLVNFFRIGEESTGSRGSPRGSFIPPPPRPPSDSDDDFELPRLRSR